ncbi:YicC/YloC family endoribonuclease [Salibacterium halotolerans]|uniref:TIGR00255 family protein n=1 Tax=Salibacterium halotolerans TaxID=1884432 RepID=A0A1I5M833_9BACI|nr:YicC/YloC family endoribonuclease [Salibacterium halotolerans]SFP05744.1 TIGR00255 family protein [Salibacterium halotolerans]
MLRSMTGYGSSTVETGEGRITVEMKSVNHRYCDILFRMPRALNYLEDTLRRRVQEKVERGRVEVFISLEGEARSKRDVTVDWGLLHQFLDRADEMEQWNVFDARLRLQDFLLHPDISAVEERSGLNDTWESGVEEAVKEASADLSEMRQKEGEALQADLENRLAVIKQEAEDIYRNAPSVVEAYRRRLYERIQEAIRETGYAPDEQRLLTEAAVFADKADVQEEVTRLFSHCSQFSSILGEEGAKGRKLDFLMQEMNREANTIGSKAGSAELGRIVVEMKSELEKMKEQVQNIE